MVVGFLWYSNVVFGKAWTRLQGLTDESLKTSQKQLGKLYGLSFILPLITSYVLAHVMEFSEAFYGYGFIQTGLTSAFFMWIGFVMPVQLTTELFGQKRWKLLAINTSYQLAWLLVAGVIIGWLG